MIVEDTRVTDGAAPRLPGEEGGARTGTETTRITDHVVMVVEAEAEVEAEAGEGIDRHTMEGLPAEK